LLIVGSVELVGSKLLADSEVRVDRDLEATAATPRAS
jgi:hypothetical protein